MAAALEPRLPAAALAQASVLQARLLLCLCTFSGPLALYVPQKRLIWQARGSVASSSGVGRPDVEPGTMASERKPCALSLYTTSSRLVLPCHCCSPG